MLVIRDEQMVIFHKAALCRFEDEMLIHLCEFSPSLFKTIDEEQWRKVIILGISNASSYGFYFRGPTQLYLELMLLFGSYFDTDPQYPWAAEILNNQDVGSQMRCAERLYEKSMDYRQKVTGHEDAYSLESLKNIAIFAKQPLLLSLDDFIPAMLLEISNIYPQKAAYVGRDSLETLIRKGMIDAQRQHFSTVRGVTLLIVLMLAFGHGCGSDPLYPWIAKTLKDDTTADPETRVKRLEKNALTWLEHVLAYFDKGRKHE